MINYPAKMLDTNNYLTKIKQYVDVTTIQKFSNIDVNTL